MARKKKQIEKDVEFLGKTERLGKQSFGSGENSSGAQRIEKYDRATEKKIDEIYGHIRSGRIWLYPAAIGFVYNSGHPVYDYDDLFALLVQYGYENVIVAKFIDRFSETPLFEGETPIVITNKNQVDIYDDDIVKPIPEAGKN